MTANRFDVSAGMLVCTIAASATLLLQGCVSTTDPTIARQDAAVHDPAALMRIGEAAEGSGDLATADGFYSRAADMDADLTFASLAHARVLARQGDIAGSLAALRETHERHPEDLTVTATLGRMLIVQKRPAEALPVFDAGLQAQPDAPPLLIGKGVALDLIGRHTEAQSAYEAVLRSDPDNAAAKSDLEQSRARK